MKSSNKFWVNDIGVLFHQDKLTKFFPDEKMSLEEKLNSIVRLSVYVSILLFVYNKNYNNIYFFLITLVLTYFIYKYSNKDAQTETIKEHLYEKGKKDLLLTEKKIVKPTNNNPFGNILLSEYQTHPNRDTNIDVDNKQVMEDVSDKFNTNLYKDVNDILNRNNSQRQFFTNPIRTIPNKQNEFAKWCYGKPKTCKENNGHQCAANNFTPLYAQSRLPMI